MHEDTAQASGADECDLPGSVRPEYPSDLFTQFGDMIPDSPDAERSEFSQIPTNQALSYSVNFFQINRGYDLNIFLFQMVQCAKIGRHASDNEVFLVYSGAFFF